MRDLFEPETGRSLPVPRGFSLAAGRRKGAGSQHTGAVPDRAEPGSAGRTVLPVGQEAGGDVCDYDMKTGTCFRCSK